MGDKGEARQEMRKIRRFKILIHHKEIIRRVNRAVPDLKSGGFENDQSIAEFVSCLAGEMEPAVVFDSFENNNFAEVVAVKKEGTFSAAVVTLGGGLEAKINSFSEPASMEIALIAAGEFFECAVDFVLGLIKEEAEKESFVLDQPKFFIAPVFPFKDPLYPPRFLKEGTTYSGQAGAFFDKNLSCDKISVTFNEGKPSPALTTAFAVGWLSKKKSKNR
ncbi:MAG: hypothetical protein NTW04_01350 [Elusimicrobia bacterium]|nr:hypothetical protein [Elusimicrobiota bacterium]